LIILLLLVAVVVAVHQHPAEAAAVAALADILSEHLTQSQRELHILLLLARGAPVAVVRQTELSEVFLAGIQMLLVAAQK
jgi:hypothetical protein